jgi:hypothetical protein
LQLLDPLLSRFVRNRNVVFGWICLTHAFPPHSPPARPLNGNDS